jgi:hypothetical protein
MCLAQNIPLTDAPHPNMPDRTLAYYFNSGPPPNAQGCEVVAQDETGDYQLPFVCEWRDGAWYRMGMTKPLVAKIIGWRIASPPKKK